MQGLHVSISVPGFVFLVCYLVLVTTDSSDGISNKKVDINTRDVNFSVRACQFAVVKFHTSHENETFTLALDVPRPGGYKTYLRNSKQLSEKSSDKNLNCNSKKEFKATLADGYFEISRFTDDGQNHMFIKIDTTIPTDVTITMLQMKTIWNTGNWTVQNKHGMTQKQDALSSSGTWSFLTPATFPRRFNNFRIAFKIRACKHVQIGFKLDGKFHDVIIGENGNNLSQLYIDGSLADGSKTTYSGSLLSCDAYKSFTLSFLAGYMKLSYGNAGGTFTSIIEYGFADIPQVINSFKFKTVGVDGSWKSDLDGTSYSSRGFLVWEDIPTFTDHDMTVTLNTHLSFSVKSCQHAVIKFSLTNHDADIESLILTIDKPILDEGLKYKSTLCNSNDWQNCDNYEGSRFLNCSKSVEFKAEILEHALRIQTTGMELKRRTGLNGASRFQNVEVSTVWNTGQWLIGEKHINTGNSAQLNPSGISTKEELCRNMYRFGVNGYQGGQIDINDGKVYTVVIGGLSDTTVQIYKDFILMVENVSSSAVLSTTEYFNFTLKIGNGKISLFSGTGNSQILIIEYNNPDITNDFSSDNCRVAFHSYLVTWKLYEIPCGAKRMAFNGTIKSPGYPDFYSANIECVFTITRPEGEYISLTFTHFDLEYEHTCNFDYVLVRNGGSSSSLHLGTFCGNIIPDPVITTQHMMWIKFKTDHSVQKTGFYASYTSARIPTRSTTLSATQTELSSIGFIERNNTKVRTTNANETTTAMNDGATTAIIDETTTTANKRTTAKSNDETTITTNKEMTTTINKRTTTESNDERTIITDKRTTTSANDGTTIAPKKETTTTVNDETSNTIGTTTQIKQTTDGLVSRITTLRDLTVTPSLLKAITMLAQESVKELAAEMKATKKKLTVKKTKTSTYIRTKTCAEDNRVSSITIGAVGIVFLALTFIIVCVVDLPNLKNMFIQLYQNLLNSEMAHAYRTCKAKTMHRSPRLTNQVSKEKGQS